MLTVGDYFPGYSLKGVNKDNEFVSLRLDDGNWRVIYFYPKDFTFICPTEIAAMDMLNDEAEVIGISGDNEFCKLAWKESNTLIQDIQHTLAADCGLVLSEDLGIVNYIENVCYRATFIVDPESVIQHVSVNALDTGRNANEVLRTIQALKAGGLTACSWTPGQEFV